jgi:hypothetical protein
MPNVLTTSSPVTCGHSPGAVAAASTAKLAVGGARVLQEAGVQDAAVSGCGTIPAADGSGTPTDIKCLTVTAVSGVFSTKLTCGGKPVILETLSGATNGMVAKLTPQTLVNGTAGQTKLTGI